MAEPTPLEHALSLIREPGGAVCTLSRGSARVLLAEIERLRREVEESEADATGLYADLCNAREAVERLRAENERLRKGSA